MTTWMKAEDVTEPGTYWHWEPPWPIAAVRIDWTDTGPRDRPPVRVLWVDGFGEDNTDRLSNYDGLFWGPLTPPAAPQP